MAERVRHYCAYCGAPSDRGCIRVCRKCSGLTKREKQRQVLRRFAGRRYLAEHERGET